MNDNLKSLRDSINSPEVMNGFIEKMKFENDIKKKHIQNIKKMFHNQETFDLLVNKILNKHDDVYINRCYKNGYLPHPMNILYTLFDLAELEGVELSDSLDGLTDNFPSYIMEYMDWQFAVTHGQGSVCSVYYKKELKYRD